MLQRGWFLRAVNPSRLVKAKNRKSISGNELRKPMKINDLHLDTHEKADIICSTGVRDMARSLKRAGSTGRLERQYTRLFVVSQKQLSDEDSLVQPSPLDFVPSHATDGVASEPVFVDCLDAGVERNTPPNPTNPS